MTNYYFTATLSQSRRWLTRVLTWLWNWLRSPWLAIIAGLIAVILSIAVWQLPQLPGQLVNEKAASTTWLLDTSSAYGVWGNLYLSLGVFDILRSPLLYLLLALLIPTLAAQFADQLGAFRQMREIRSFTLETPSHEPGEAIPLSSLRPLYRWRGVVPASTRELFPILEERVNALSSVTKAATAPILTSPAISLSSESGASVQESELRLVGTRFAALHYVRPLFMFGLLVAVAGAWIALAFGWQLASPPLAPGDTFRSASHNLMVSYTIVPTDTTNTALQATLEGQSVILPVGESIRGALASATIQVRPLYPAIWVATSDGSKRLALPGQSKLLSQIGLVFETPGSEESLVLPDKGVGVRIVQLSGSNNFVLELYRSDAVQPIYRAELTNGGHLSIPLAPGEIELVFTTLPGLQVDVRHLPGLWLVPLGILLALAGAVAFVRPSTFVTVQAAPWASAANQSVVILQSDHPNVIARLRAALNTIPLPTEGEISEAISADPISPTASPNAS